MWIARDKSGSLWMYEDEPIRFKTGYFVGKGIKISDIPNKPSITWENSPFKVIDIKI